MSADKLPALAARFHLLFAGLERAHGCSIIDKNAVPDEAGKINARSFTEHKQVTDGVWLAHLSGEKGIGIIPIRDDSTVMWAAIDIDQYPLDLTALEATLEELMLPLVVCRTKSGGAHLYLFCKEPIPARIVRLKMAEWSVAIGHPGVEVFPKQSSLANNKDVGNWLNMPYFDAPHKTTRHGWHEGKAMKIEAFLDFAESRKVSAAALDAFTLPSAMGDAEFADGPPCLQHLAAKGFPRGSRNNALFNLAVFARLRYPDDWKEKIDEYNRTLMQPPLGTSEVMAVIKSAGRKEYFYTCNKDPIASVCNKEVCRTRKFGIGNTSEGSLAPVMLGALTKIDSNPPMWIIDVEGYRLELTAEDLMQQQRFRKMCMEKVNKLPAMMPQSAWEGLIRERLAQVEIIAAPPDSGPEGQFKSHLENFCSSRVSANNQDELLLGKPWHDEAEGVTWFRSPDLLRYLDQQHFREFKERQIWGILRGMGAGHKQVMIKGKCVSIWSVPMFSKQSEGFEVPRGWPISEL